MAMFDWVRFQYRMPDGYEGRTYQTKWLDCELDVYLVTPDGRFVRTEAMEGNKPVGAVAFDGVLWIGDAEGGHQSHCYNLHFKAGQLVAIECLQTNATMIFGASGAALLGIEAA